MSVIVRVVALASVVAWSGCAMRAAREVRLVATGMTFALAEDPGTANPPLTFRAGERIRLVLTNDAPGLRHDVAIPAWNVAIDPIGSGETANVTFTVPATGGQADYLCRPHSTMMRGSVNVDNVTER